MKWEYMVVDLSFESDKDVELRLDSLGSVGWELVTFIRRTAYLKRAKP